MLHTIMLYVIFKIREKVLKTNCSPHSLTIPLVFPYDPMIYPLEPPFRTPAMEVQGFEGQAKAIRYVAA